MSIYRENGTIIVVCDRCDAVEFDTEVKTFHEANRAAHEDGWRYDCWQKGEPPMHRCPDCRGKAKA